MCCIEALGSDGNKIDSDSHTVAYCGKHNACMPLSPCSRLGVFVITVVVVVVVCCLTKVGSHTTPANSTEARVESACCRRQVTAKV